ncbi:MAG: phosphatase PAP2 family protein [Gemmatimonadota bacterium]|nr:phosphatase PAP2 family protein [Gemmatimonadota bacterium]
MVRFEAIGGGRILSGTNFRELLMISPTMLLSSLGTHDRTLFQRWALADSSRRARLIWTFLTNAGGATCTIIAATLPLFLGGAFAEAAQRALITLVVSHLIVQLIKRTVGRPRPSRTMASAALVIEPDRFSFPSGHAAAAMAVAFIYASAYPSLALPLVLLAGAVGMSRVFLGVHYPGDVLIGQLIAVLTGLVALHGWQ